jgi:hypothetical protein
MEEHMTIVSRRIVPFAVALAIAATLAVWMTAGAASPRSNATPLPRMHFMGVTTSMHISLNGATDKKPAGATIQQIQKLLVSGKQIGRAFIVGTFINNAGWGLLNIEARFPGRGRLELQGVTNGSKNNTYAIVGGTGVFTTARGWAHGNHGNITVTFR